MSTASAFAEWFQTMIGKKTTQTLDDLLETSNTDEETNETGDN